MSQGSGCELWGYLIDVDHNSPEVVLSRLGQLPSLVLDALQAGIEVSRQVHGDREWNPVADIHLFRQLVRREAMERLKPYGSRVEDDTDLDDGDNLGLPMSGLILGLSTGDVVRVWHSSDGEMPPMDSMAKRAFCRQEPSAQGTLFAASEQDVCSERASNTALLWDDDGSQITRFDLVRPFGVQGQRALVDWPVNLLVDLSRMPDLPIARDDEGDTGLDTGSAG